jgi:site-specific DNA recombinase
MLRAAFLERVSNDELAERNTIRTQDASLHKTYDWHFAEGSAEPWDFVGTFADDGVSGTIPLDQRPEGRRLMALVRAGEVDIVCVTRGDRLARDRGVAEAIADEFWGREVRIEAVNDHIDLTTPAGRLHFAIMCAFSHYERELIRDRTTLGRDQKASEGKFINGPVPFGYEVVGERLVPSTRRIEQLCSEEEAVTEADVVREMFRRVRTGDSALAVLRWLRQAGVPSVHRYYDKRADRYTEVSHPLWQYPRVREILRSSTYHGKRVLKYAKPNSGRFKKQIEPVIQVVPALVSKEVWDSVSVAMKGHTSNFHKGEAEGYVYLLTGKVVCGYCGFNMGGNHHVRPGGKEYLYYACSGKSASKTNARRTGVVCGDSPRLNGYALEARVLEMIDDLVDDPHQAFAALLGEQREQYAVVDEHGLRARAVQQRVAGLQRGRASLVQSLREGLITPDEFRDSSAATARDLAEAQRELAALEAEASVARTLDEQLQQAQAVIDLLTEEWPQARADNDRPALRAMLQPLVQKITVRQADIEYRILFQSSSDRTQSCDCLQIVRTTDLIGLVARAA